MTYAPLPILETTEVVLEKLSAPPEIKPANHDSMIPKGNKLIHHLCPLKNVENHPAIHLCLPMEST